MRLLEFHGYGIRGYQEQHIRFRDEMTFLIGINGSGKTTVLNLIQGLLRPSFHILDSIEFDSIQITFEIEEGSKIIKVTCDKSEENLHLWYFQDEMNFDYVFKRMSQKKSGIEEEESHDVYEKIREDFDNNALCRMIASYKAPMFLTLDRLPQELSVRRLFMNSAPRRFLMERGSIDTCLYTIQEAINNMYRINATKQNSYIVDLRNQILKKSLSVMTDDFFSSRRTDDETYKGLDTIEQREKEFLEVMDGLGIPDIKEVSSAFFSRLKMAADVLRSDVNSKDDRLKASATWILSQSQLQRVEEISKLGHEYQKKVARLQEPLSRFEDCVNMFFSECKKRFLLDKSGKMKVICPKGIGKHIVNEVTELSSGEKQIVAILGSLIFLQEEKDTNVYFIDEPEVSLHLSWQDIFVDALLKACPKYQFVLATHSPNIIAKEERRSWCEDLSPKFLKDGVR